MSNEGLWLASMGFGIASVFWLVRYAPGILTDALSILPVAMNMQVGTLMPLWGRVVPGGDMLAVIYGLGVNMLAYHQGAGVAQQCVRRSSHILVVWFVLMSVHALFYPWQEDPLNVAQHQALAMLPRLCVASWCAFYVSQHLERAVFAAWVERGLVWAHAVSFAVSQCVDTVVFSFLAFYGQAVMFDQLVVWSLWIKCLGGMITSLAIWGVYGYERRFSF